MQLAQCTDSRMVNIVVYNFGCIEQAEGSRDSVAECDGVPRRVEATESLCLFLWCIVLLTRFLHTPNGGFGSLCCDIFDQVGDEEVARHQEVEGEAVVDVLPAVVVALDADEKSILVKSVT